MAFKGIVNWNTINIHLAAYFGLKESMSALLDKNANVVSTDKYCRTPLSLAAVNGHEGEAAA
jgi:ankyrin repeat protein